MMAKKKVRKSPPTNVEALKADFKKRGLHLISGKDLETAQHIRNPCGVPSVDLEMGGGAGAGTGTVLYGPEGAGKTLFSIWYMREAQKRHGKKFKALFLSLGLPLDKPYARIQGLRIPFNPREKEEFKALYRAHHQSDPTPAEVKKAGESLGQVDFLLADYGSPQALERVLAGFIDLVATREYQVAVVDDLGAIPPQEVLDAGFQGETKRGPFARLFGAFTQQLNLFLQFHEGTFNPTSVIITSQVRSMMASAGGKGPAWTLPFGYALKHNTSAVLRVTKTMKYDEATKKPKGLELTWKITRGKYGHGEGATGSFPFHPFTGVDVTMDLARAAVLHDVVTSAGGAWFYWGDERVAQGYDALCHWIEGNSMFGEIWAALCRKKGIVA